MKKKHQPLVSIRLMVYNNEPYIRETIDGILMQQTTFKVEIVVGDDFSTDDTLHIIKQYKDTENIYFNILDRPIGGIYWKERKRLGRLYNFKNIIENCSGKYIALLDGDDYWTAPLKLQKQVDFLESNPDYTLCFHKVNILKTDGTVVDDFMTNVPDNYETIETLARFGNYIHSPTAVFRNIIKEFPFEFDETPIGDFFLYIMLAEQGKLKCLEEKMAIYRFGIGIVSKMSFLTAHYSKIKFYSCIASYVNDDALKKIFFDNQLATLERMEQRLSMDNESYFMNKNKFVKYAVYFSKNYNKPLKIIQKLFNIK